MRHGGRRRTDGADRPTGPCLAVVQRVGVRTRSRERQDHLCTRGTEASRFADTRSSSRNRSRNTRGTTRTDARCTCRIVSKSRTGTQAARERAGNRRGVGRHGLLGLGALRSRSHFASSCGCALIVRAASNRPLASPERFAASSAPEAVWHVSQPETGCAAYSQSSSGKSTGAPG